MRRQPPIHPLGCACRTCAPIARQGRGAVIACALTRALVLFAALCAIPFILAWAIATTGGERR